MRAEKKTRIDTAANQGPLAKLGAAFHGLELPELPPAPSVSQPSPPLQPPQARSVWKLGRVVLRRETAHRGGKVVIVIHDFAPHLPSSVIETVAKKIRSGCGCGGTVKERSIEIQGDQVQKIRQLLEGEGFQVAGVR